MYFAGIIFWNTPLIPKRTTTKYPNVFEKGDFQPGNISKRKKAFNACKKYNAVILDSTNKSKVVQITALRREIDTMAKNLRKFGLVSVSRTGAVAMTRGEKVFK